MAGLGERARSSDSFRITSWWRQRDGSVTQTAKPAFISCPSGCVCVCVGFNYKLWAEKGGNRLVGFVCVGSGLREVQEVVRLFFFFFSAAWIVEKMGHDARRCQAALCCVFSAELDNWANLAVSLVHQCSNISTQCWYAGGPTLHACTFKMFIVKRSRIYDGFSKTEGLSTVEISVVANETECLIKASASYPCRQKKKKKLCAGLCVDRI